MTSRPRSMQEDSTTVYHVGRWIDFDSTGWRRGGGEVKVDGDGLSWSKSDLGRSTRRVETEPKNTDRFDSGNIKSQSQTMHGGFYRETSPQSLPLSSETVDRLHLCRTGRCLDRTEREEMGQWPPASHPAWRQQNQTVNGLMSSWDGPVVGIQWWTCNPTRHVATFPGFQDLQ